MNKDKDEFYNAISTALSDYYSKSPCKHCHSGNGCDDCRGCKGGYVDQDMRIAINKMKDEFKLYFGISYNSEVEERNKRHYKEVRKKESLKEVWENCTLNEIIQYGIENDKCNKNDIEHLFNWL